MKLFSKTEDISDYISDLKKKNKNIGFIPTMGALHDGHFSLIKRSQSENDVSICSIYVNPTQFNEKSDLAQYPRNLEMDKKALEEMGCDVLFCPGFDDIYPDGSDYEVEVDLKGLDLLMEGAMRPGHFKGVVQVVKRLLEIVNCDRFYMGQKDYQQFTIILQMIKDLQLSAQLVICPISREDDGLARSSRNTRLSKHHRKKASIIYRVLKQAVIWWNEGRSPVEISHKAKEYLEIPGFEPEYFDIIDGLNLQKVSDRSGHDIVVACTAVWAGDVRLIDNMILKGQLNRD